MARRRNLRPNASSIMLRNAPTGPGTDWACEPGSLRTVFRSSARPARKDRVTVRSAARADRERSRHSDACGTLAGGRSCARYLLLISLSLASLWFPAELDPPGFAESARDDTEHDRGI